MAANAPSRVADPAGPLRRAAAALALPSILLIGLGLRLRGLTEASLWFDEANGLFFAQAPLRELPGLLARDSSPPLYYLAMHFWIPLLGPGEAAVRSFSLLCGLASAALAYQLGRELLGREAGLWAALWIALSPVAVFQSQQARMYTLLPLLGTAALLFAARALERGRRRDFAWAALFTLLALYTHNFALHLLPALGLLALAAGGLARGRRLPLLAAGLALTIGYLPWLPVFLRQLHAPHQYEWFAGATRDWSWFTYLVYSIRAFSPGGEGSMFGGHRTDLWGGVPALCTLALVFLGAGRLCARRRALPAARIWALPLAFAVPLLSALLASAATTPHLVPGRVDQLVLPPFALLAGLGLAALPSRWLKGAAAAALLGLSLSTLARFSQAPERLGFDGADREAAEAIATRLRPGDTLLCAGWTSESIRYYLRLEGLEPPVLSFLAFLPELGDRQRDGEEAFLAEWIERVRAGLAGGLGPGGRIFLVSVGDPASRRVLDELFRRVPLTPLLSLGTFLQAGFSLPMEVTLLEPGA